MTRIVVDKSTDHAKLQFDLFLFLLQHYINVKENVFLERELKKALLGILTG